MYRCKCIMKIYCLRPYPSEDFEEIVSDHILVPGDFAKLSIKSE